MSNVRFRGFLSHWISCALYLTTISFALAWYSRLPNPIAVMWNSNDNVTTVSLPKFYLVVALLGLVPLVLLGAAATRTVSDGARRQYARAGAGLVTLVCGMSLHLAAIQLDANDATGVETPNAAWFVGIALVAAVFGYAAGVDSVRALSSYEVDGDADPVAGLRTPK